MAFSWRARDDAHLPNPKRLPWKDYAPPEVHAAQMAAAAVNAMSDDPFEYTNALPSLGDFRKLATEINQVKPSLSALEEIAINIRGLPYGEFMELAEGIGAQPKSVPEPSSATKALWKWAATYG
jgi:hypothetical protein